MTQLKYRSLKERLFTERMCLHRPMKDFWFNSALLYSVQSSHLLFHFYYHFCRFVAILLLLYSLRYIPLRPHHHHHIVFLNVFSDICCEWVWKPWENKKRKDRPGNGSRLTCSGLSLSSLSFRFLSFFVSGSLCLFKVSLLLFAKI